jgi:Family of unknown function (DUF6340)
MKIFFFILVIFFAAGGLESCISYVYIPKYYPPEITPPEKPVKIVFINNFNYHNPEIVKEKNHVTYERSITGFRKGVEKALTGNDSIRVIIGDTLRNETAAGMLTTLLPIETIAQNCEKYNAGMLVSLDSVNIGFNSRTDYVESIRIVNIYSRSFYLVAEFFLSAYAPNGDLINRSSVDRTFYYSWRMALTSDVAFDPSLAGASRKIDKVSIPCGGDYALKFKSFSEVVTRKVHAESVFEESNALMKKREWDEAIEKLKVISESKKASVALKALDNLEVAKEGAGK